MNMITVKLYGHPHYTPVSVTNKIAIWLQQHPFNRQPVYKTKTLTYLLQPLKKPLFREPVPKRQLLKDKYEKTNFT